MGTPTGLLALAVARLCRRLLAEDTVIAWMMLFGSRSLILRTASRRLTGALVLIASVPQTGGIVLLNPMLMIGLTTCMT